MKKLLFTLIILLSLPALLWAIPYRTGIFHQIYPGAGKNFYEKKDTIYLDEGEKYEANFHLFLPNVISGTREFSIDYAPDYFFTGLYFNSERYDGRGISLDWYNGDFIDYTFETEVKANMYVGTWTYINPDGELWMGDVEFVNSLNPGDSLVYSIAVEAITTNGAKNRYTHTRTIICKGEEEKTATAIMNFDNSNKLSVYPNPCRNIVNVDLKAGKQTRAILFNKSAQVVREVNLQPGGNQIDVSSLKPGVYFLKTEEEVFKLVKN